MKRLLVILMVLFIASAIITTLNRKSVLEQESAKISQEVLVSEDEPALKEGSKGPSIQKWQLDVFYTLEGDPVKYNNVIFHPKTILFLWTSKCSLCKDMLVDLSKDCFSYKGVKIVFINLGESQERVKRFVDYYKLDKCISDRILLDKVGHSAIEFFVTSVPTVVFFEYGNPIYKAYTLNKYLIDKVYDKD